VLRARITAEKWLNKAGALQTIDEMLPIGSQLRKSSTSETKGSGLRISQNVN
jgi:hypothetical protein